MSQRNFESAMSSSDDDFDRTCFESASNDDETTNDESNTEFIQHHGLIEKVTFASKDNTINKMYRRVTFELVFWCSTSG